MLTTISKTFDFDAAHRLNREGSEHKCYRLHGHTYKVEIRLRGEPGARRGMLIDYAEIAKAWDRVHAKIDHQTLLSDDDPVGPALVALALPVVVFDFATTTEKLSEWMEGQLAPSFGGLSVAVRVYESSTTYAEVGRT